MQKLIKELSIYCVFINITLFFFAIYNQNIELQMLSLVNVALFMVYFIGRED